MVSTFCGKRRGRAEPACRIRIGGLVKSEDSGGETLGVDDSGWHFSQAWWSSAFDGLLSSKQGRLASI